MFGFVTGMSLASFGILLWFCDENCNLIAKSRAESLESCFQFTCLISLGFYVLLKLHMPGIFYVFSSVSLSVSF